MPMLRSILIIAALATKLISCSDASSEYDTSDWTQPSKNLHCNALRTAFRLAKGSSMFYDIGGIPYQYHIPRADILLEDLNNGRIRIPTSEYSMHRRMQVAASSRFAQAGSRDPVTGKRVYNKDRFCWRLANTTRSLIALESINAHLWKRDTAPLNRLICLMESPVFLGNFFYALTSLTEFNGAVVLSRFYYAPVLTARYRNILRNSTYMAVSDMELNVFSVCIEPSDAPEDASIPLAHRPQRIIDAGLRKNEHNLVYDVETMLRANATDKLAKAEDHFTSVKWNALFIDFERMAFKRLPKQGSPYSTIKTPFGDYFRDCLAGNGPGQTAFHRYDFENAAYIFAHGAGSQAGFAQDLDACKLLIFLNPRTHFRNERKLWSMCVDLWKKEMHARYGTDANSRLVHPHAYMDEDSSTEPYYEMVPRYEALKKILKRKPSTEIDQVGNSKVLLRPDSPRRRKAVDTSGRPHTLNAPKPIPDTVEVDGLRTEILDSEDPSGDALPSRRIPSNEASSLTTRVVNSVNRNDKELADYLVFSDTEQETNERLLGPSGGGRGRGLNMCGTSGPFINESKYQTDMLPCTSYSGNIGAYADESLFQPPDIESTFSSSPSYIEPYCTQAGPSGLSYQPADCTVQIPASAQATELNHASTVFKRRLQFEPAYGGMAPELLTELQQIDEASLTDILGDAQ